MKQDHNLVWSNTHGDGSITIGFTKKCIDEMLTECFHVMQADSSAVREKGPMLVLETNDGLESIKSPFTGRISYFNPKARNYPDKITEEDTILTILPKGVEEKVKPKVTPKPVVQDFLGRANEAPQPAVRVNMPAGQRAPRNEGEPFGEWIRRTDREWIAANPVARDPQLNRQRRVR